MSEKELLGEKPRLPVYLGEKPRLPVYNV